MSEPKTPPPLTGDAAEKRNAPPDAPRLCRGRRGRPGRPRRLAVVADGSSRRRSAVAAAAHAPFQPGFGREPVLFKPPGPDLPGLARPGRGADERSGWPGGESRPSLALRIQHEGRPGEKTLDLAAVQAGPRIDLVTEFKCVEGWGEVMHFGGVRFLDFVTKLGLATRSGQAPDPQSNPRDLYRYVYLATPNEEYYVGLDMASALHPQTLLCDTMNGQPLTGEHGAPLRLYLAVKYGYKSLKRIGLIRFQDEPPPDYWAERGYDWYAGL